MEEKLIKHIEETLMHKQYVLESAKILSEYLINIGNPSVALMLVKRCSCHDDSKFSLQEISVLSKIDNPSNFRNADTDLTEAEKELVRLHGTHNRHHPEYFDKITEMKDLDLMEMACDCNARSMEYGTDLLEFIEVRQNNRFHMPEDMYNQYKKYCSILVEGVLKKDSNKTFFKK